MKGKGKMGACGSANQHINENTDMTHFDLGVTLGRGAFGHVVSAQKLTEPMKDTWFAIKKLDKRGSLS